MLCVRDLSVRLGNKQVLKDITFELPPHETLVCLGDSGCGKTTLMKILAGLTESDTGVVEMAGERLVGKSPRQRGVVYLDQESLLFEHLNVYENVAFAMRLRKKNAKVVDHSVREILAAVGLSDQLRKRDWQLSGGQKQRVAFSRAILAEPRLLLLDEPFCSLDDRSRGAMQRLYCDLRQKYQMTAIFVTHDVREALAIGTQFMLLVDGRLRCYSTRQDFIADPATGVADEMRFWNGVRQEAETFSSRSEPGSPS